MLFLLLKSHIFLSPWTNPSPGSFTINKNLQHTEKRKKKRPKITKEKPATSIQNNKNHKPEPVSHNNNINRFKSNHKVRTNQTNPTSRLTIHEPFESDFVQQQHNPTKILIKTQNQFPPPVNPTQIVRPPENNKIKIIRHKRSKHNRIYNKVVRCFESQYILCFGCFFFRNREERSQASLSSYIHGSSIINNDYINSYLIWNI